MRHPNATGMAESSPEHDCDDTASSVLMELSHVLCDKAKTLQRLAEKPGLASTSRFTPYHRSKRTTDEGSGSTREGQHGISVSALALSLAKRVYTCR